MEASRTQFEVLGFEGQVLSFGLEAYKSSKMPVLGRALFLDLLKMGPGHAVFFNDWYFAANLQFSGVKTFPFFRFLETARNFADNLQFYLGEEFFSGEQLRVVPWSLASSIPRSRVLDFTSKALFLICS